MKLTVSSICLLASLWIPVTAAVAAPDNTPPEGYLALFNGKDLTGWKGLVADPPQRAKMSPEELARAQEAADQKIREHWRVQDGILVYDGHGDSLCTRKDYADFELFVDWKIEEKGDSGIYLRGSPQVQIWDDPVGSGGLYNNQKNPSKPLSKADRPPGEWNTFQIRMTGDRVTVHLNGAKVVDDTVMENLWERDKPIYPAGQIELQHHGSTLYFKNIYLRELSGPERLAAASAQTSGVSVARATARVGKSVLKKGARVAVVGDSITEQKLYSRYIEDYLLACLSDLDLRVIQLGWGGERAPGFAERMENDLFPYRPDVVTTCYGMNDGGYRAYEQSIGDTYKKAMLDIVRRLKAAGAVVVVGSPGAVDTTSYKNKNTPARDYNQNLSRLRDMAQEVASEEGMPFANVHDPLIRAMEKAKGALGESYDVCGTDGVHPRENGHLVMAYAFLKGLGVDGEIARITVDLKGQPAASEGHRIVSSSGGKVEVESRRYPFCFPPDDKSPRSTRSILPFVPFNEELNRFTLAVKNLGAERARVSWGGAQKTFTRQALEDGINLAAEFPENPFSGPFREVDEAVAKKQGFETPLIKEVITRFRTARNLLGDDAEGKAAIEKLSARLLEKDRAYQAQARQAVKPVLHLIEITPE